MPDPSHADSLAGAVHRLRDVVPKGDGSAGMTEVDSGLRDNEAVGAAPRAPASGPPNDPHREATYLLGPLQAPDSRRIGVSDRASETST